MRMSKPIQLILTIAIIAALIYVVIEVSSGWADWIVFAVIVCAALGGAVAIFKPEYPSPTKKRRFTRDSGSDW
jgi:hypothetical protein